MKSLSSFPSVSAHLENLVVLRVLWVEDAANEELVIVPKCIRRTSKIWSVYLELWNSFADGHTASNAPDLF